MYLFDLVKDSDEFPERILREVLTTNERLGTDFLALLKDDPELNAKALPRVMRILATSSSDDAKAVEKAVIEIINGSYLIKNPSFLAAVEPKPGYLKAAIALDLCDEDPVANAGKVAELIYTTPELFRWLGHFNEPRNYETWKKVLDKLFEHEENLEIFHEVVKTLQIRSGFNSELGHYGTGKLFELPENDETLHVLLDFLESNMPTSIVTDFSKSAYIKRWDVLNHLARSRKKKLQAMAVNALVVLPVEYDIERVLIC